MKRFISSLILASLALSSFAIEATVISVSGKAEIQNGNEWVELKAGDNLKAGSVLQTGFKSNVVLNIKSPNENSTITVAPLSRMTIEQLSQKGDQDTASIYLASGSLKSNIKKTEDKRVGYQVRTPVATASVRGTEFEVKNGYKSVDIRTSEGSVACWNEATSKPDIKQEETAEVSETESINSNEIGSTVTESTEIAKTVENTATVATTAREISRAAPKGAYTVSAGQLSSIPTTGGPSKPQESFSRTAALTSTANTASSLESIGIITSAPTTALSASGQTEAVVPPQTGSLSITVGW